MHMDAKGEGGRDELHNVSGLLFSMRKVEAEQAAAIVFFNRMRAESKDDACSLQATCAGFRKHKG
jgi:hypothetical protein